MKRFADGMIMIPGSSPEKWMLVPSKLDLEVAQVFKNKKPSIHKFPDEIWIEPIRFASHRQSE